MYDDDVTGIVVAMYDLYVTGHSYTCEHCIMIELLNQCIVHLK